MKQKSKRFIRGLLAAVAISVVYLLTGCSQQNNSTSTDGETAQQTGYYNQNMGLAFSIADGFYHVDSGNFLYFYDYQSQQDVLVCSRTNCSHEAWDDSTPDEERCDAYLGSYSSSGFVWEDALYILNSDITTQQTDLSMSKLNRSEQKELCTLPITYVESFVVYDGVLYVSGSQAKETEEDGAITLTAQTETWLIGVDLSSGEQMDLTEKQTGFNASIQMLGVRQGMLYFRRTSFEREYTGLNYEEAGFCSQLYTYDIQSKECNMVWENKDEISSLLLTADSLLYAVSQSDQSSTGTTTASYEIFSLDLETMETIPLAASIKRPTFVEGSIYYCAEENKYLCYDIDTEQTDPIDQTVIEKVDIWQTAGEYYYVVTNEINGTPYLIRKEDLKDGNDQRIEVHFYE